MSYTAQQSNYLHADVMSRPKEWLVPLLYEHLLAHLRRAAMQIEARDLAGKAVSLEKGSAIVMELLASLDHEQGGEIASRLAALYSFWTTELLAIGRSLDTAQLGRLIGMIVELHEAWTEAAERVSPRSGSGAALALSA